MTINKTVYIILRKIPFQESSLIVSGISPEYGKLDFLLKGARGTSRKKFPYAELFRELAIEFKPPHGISTLCSLCTQEPLAMFDMIGLKTENYLQMCTYAAFLLKHTAPMLELPETYRALKTLLIRLTQGNEPEFPVAAAKLAFLRESGYLPETTGHENMQRGEILGTLLEYALDPDASAPEFSEDYRKKLILWIKELCRYHDLKD